MAGSLDYQYRGVVLFKAAAGSTGDFSHAFRGRLAVPVFATAAPVVYTVDPSGGVSLGGSVAPAVAIRPATSGGLSLGGSIAPPSIVRRPAPSGGLRFGGSVAPRLVYRIAPGGGLEFGGAATPGGGSGPVAVAGGMRFGGSVAPRLVYRFAPGGGLRIGGAADVVRHGPGTLREAVYYWLAGSSALAAVVGDRIYPGLLPQDEVKPSISFAVSSRTFGRCIRGPNRTSYARVRVSSWSYDQLEAAYLADVVRRRFDGYSGWWGSVWVYYAALQNEIDLPEVDQDASGRTIYQVMTDFSVRHKVSQIDYGL